MEISWIFLIIISQFLYWFNFFTKSFKHNHSFSLLRKRYITVSKIITNMKIINNLNISYNYFPIYSYNKLSLYWISLISFQNDYLNTATLFCSLKENYVFQHPKYKIITDMQILIRRIFLIIISYFIELV